MKYIQPEIYEFDSPEVENGLIIAKVLPDQVHSYAPSVLRVMAMAYERQFEGDKKLPAGAARRHFKPYDTNAHTRQAARMQQYMEQHGSAYWIALTHQFEAQGQGLLGIAKASPSRPGLRKLGKLLPSIDPNCYLNDISVATPRKRVGSALLYAVLQDYDPERVLVADVLPGSTAFFTEHGLEAEQTLDNKLEIDGNRLELVRHLGHVGTVEEALVERTPWLADAI